MKRPFFLTIPPTIPAEAVLFDIVNAVISIADTSIRINDVTSSEDNNSSTTATTTMTMTTAPDEGR